MAQIAQGQSIETGLNTAVVYLGQEYHVQTQCSHRGVPVIESLVFQEGQTLVRFTSTYGDVAESFGVWLDSESILLDGIFNWISFVMALVSLKVASLIERPGDEEFPFGYAAFEPAVNTVKAFLVLGVSVFALQFARLLFAHIGKHHELGLFEQFAEADILDHMHELFVFGHALKHLIHF